MLEKLLLASIVTLCLNLLVVVSLSNNQTNTKSSSIAEQIATGKKWLAPIGSNWQQYQLSPLTTK